MPSRISRSDHLRGRPTAASGGSSGRRTFHSASVRSFGYVGRVMGAPPPTDRALSMPRENLRQHVFQTRFNACSGLRVAQKGRRVTLSLQRRQRRSLLPVGLPGSAGGVSWHGPVSSRASPAPCRAPSRSVICCLTSLALLHASTCAVDLPAPMTPSSFWLDFSGPCLWPMTQAREFHAA